ncbi:septum formation protein Maf [Polynucleobacter paneuropaeus]|nr:septum formation protein Maf [Polynucleobacter paneuropaeus]
MFPYIYLASQSPRRQELLKQIGVKFEMLAPEPGEDSESIEASHPDEKARDYVERVTLAKSAAALERHIERVLPWAPILCADTTVSLPGHIGGEILGKPFDAVDAERILKLLSGKTHQVLTAIALRISPTSEPVSLVQISEVTFASLSEDQISKYITSGEVFGKAGAYGIQGLGSAFIESITGSYSGIMGLPLFEISKLFNLAQVTYTLSTSHE